MPTSTVIRPASAALRVGDDFTFADGEKTFTGVVVRLTPVPKVKTHVAVVIELDEAEHRRLMLGA